MCASKVMWFDKYRRFLFIVVLMYSSDLRKCNAISNTQFNANIREYAVAEDSNSTDVKTLQKEIHERYAQLAPVRNPIRFKEVPDSQLAPSSTYGRGLLHLNHHGYGLSDYEESPYHGYAYEYHFPDDHHGHYDDHDHHHDHAHHHDHDHHHGYLEHHGHHVSHYDDHKHDYGHHHKHYDHALAAKTVLWPIAGIALLGAAAALVSNPVLLQLGVVSGRRRRRDTEEITTEKQDIILTRKGLQDEFVLRNLRHFNKNNETTSNSKLNKRIGRNKRGMLLNNAMNNNHRLLFRNVNPTIKAVTQSVSNELQNNGDSIDKHYIPIPLMFKEIDST